MAQVDVAEGEAVAPRSLPTTRVENRVLYR